jgi:hypothetical protein
LEAWWRVYEVCVAATFGFDDRRHTRATEGTIGHRVVLSGADGATARAWLGVESWAGGALVVGLRCRVGRELTVEIWLWEIARERSGRLRARRAGSPAGVPARRLSEPWA